MKLFEYLKRLFSPKPPMPAPGGMAMPASDAEMAQKILGMLEKTQDEELTCDDVFALLDQFAEMAARGEDVASLMPMVKQHLDLCGDCREEYESLLRVITNPG
jgi:hypothetical protein